MRADVDLPVYAREERSDEGVAHLAARKLSEELVELVLERAWS